MAYLQSPTSFVACTFEDNSFDIGAIDVKSAKLSLTNSSFSSSDPSSACVVYSESAATGDLALFYMTDAEWMTDGKICAAGPPLVYNSRLTLQSIFSDDTPYSDILQCGDSDIADFCDPAYCTNEQSGFLGIECYCSVDDGKVDPMLGSCVSHQLIYITATSLELRVSKPDHGVASWLFTNQGELPLVWSLREVRNPSGVDTSWASSRGNLSACDLGTAIVNVSSDLLHARAEPYYLEYMLESNSYDSNTAIALNLSLFISANVDAAKSNVTLRSHARDIVAGGELDFVVVPVDETGLPILQASTAVFDSSVEPQDGSSKVVCPIAYQADEDAHVGVCQLPELKVGQFALSVKNRNGDSIGNTTWHFAVKHRPNGGLQRTHEDPSRCVCPPGMYYFGGVCEPCGEGEYQPEYGIPSSCDKCDTNLHLTSNSDHTACSVCLAGYYRTIPNEADPADVSCDACPPNNVKCDVDGNDIHSLELRPGYYRRDSETPADYIQSCPYEKNTACPGGTLTGDDSCGEGYTSVLCAACADGFFFLVRQCEKCYEKQIKSVVVWGLVAVLIGISLLLALRRFHQIRGLWEFLWSSLSTQFKTIWSGAQIMSSFPSVLFTILPGTLQRFYSSLEVTNFNPSSALALACIDHNLGLFFAELVFTTIAPVVLALVIWIAFFVRKHVLAHDADSCYRQHLRIFLLLCYLTLPSVCTVVFSAFECEDDFGPSNVSFMRADFGTSCNSDEYRHWIRPWAAASGLLYPVGVNVMYALILFRNKDAITKGEAKDIAFLHHAYNKDAWFWEPIDSLRRISLTGAVCTRARLSAYLTVVCVRYARVV